MVLSTIENVTVSVAGMAPEKISLGIDEEGLVVGPYGKISWTGSQVSVEDTGPDACTLHLRTSTGAYSTFSIPTASLGGPLSALAFGKWMLRGAALCGATVVPEPAAV